MVIDMKEAVITSSVLIVCIVLLRRLCGRKIGAKLQYMLWLVVAVRLLLPGIYTILPNAFPESAYSILNMTNEVEKAAQDYIRPSVPPIQGSLPPDGLPFLTEESADGRIVTYLLEQKIWSDIVKKIWLLGMAAVGCWIAAVNIRFRKKLFGSRQKYDRRDIKLPVYMENGKLAVYTVKELTSPCLYGLPGRQAVYLPEDVIGDEKKVRHILAHEYCHYKQKDVWWSALRCILLAAYWFHPLVWLAAVLSKQDCELACDEAALRMLGEEERIAYGKTLVSLIGRKINAADVVCAATTMTAAPRSIRERIRRIAESQHRLAFVIAPVLALVAVVAVVTFTRAKDYPEGAYPLEENALTVTTDCFQVTMPDSFAGKAYYRIENDTDIIVYHQESDLEVGRFCKILYENPELLNLKQKEGAVLIGNYGANGSLRNDMEGRVEGAAATDHYFGAEDAESAESGEQAEDIGNAEAAEDAEAEKSSGQNDLAGVPGTDSNETVTYYSPEVGAADGTAAWKASGDAEPIPAPELVEKDVIHLPYDENEDYNAVTVEDETEYLIVDENSPETEDHQFSPNENGEEAEDHQFSPDENGEEIESSVVYLPSEQITEVYLPAGQPCYLYVPADYSEADPTLQEALSEMNQALTELADSVVVLYASKAAMEETLIVLVENRTPYVGDNVRVSKIAGALPAVSGLSYQFLELKTISEPYEATLHYRLEMENAMLTDSDISFLEAVLMFAAVENLNTCNIRIYDLRKTEEETHADPSKMQSETISYDRTEMEAIFGPLYPCSESKETITELYNSVLEYLSDENNLS